MPLTLQALINNGLLDELAKCFDITKPADVGTVLTMIDFPEGNRPNPQTVSRPIDYWSQVCSDIDKGLVSGGFEPLLAAAAARLPGNKAFAPFAIGSGRPADGVPNYLQSVADDYDVFISFSSHDRAIVKQIAQALKERDVRPWLDEWALPLGEPFAGEIERILSTVKTVVVCYGTEGYGPWQEAEVDIAIDRALRDECLLIPVMLPGVAPVDLPPFLRRLKAVWVWDTVIEGSPANAEAIGRLASAILTQSSSERAIA